jgi:hypothetical protein
MALLIVGVNAVNSVIAATGVTQSWALRIDGPTNSYFEAAGMSVGPSGDVFVAAHARRFGYNHDLLISRYNSSGVRMWETRYEPEEGSAADELAAGILARGTNVYAVGTITSATATGSQDFLTLKYRDSGELEWAARLDGDGHFTDRAIAMAVDMQGNVLLVGDSIGTNGGFDIVVLKYAPTGNLLWKYSYDGPAHGSDRAVGIRVPSSGSIYVAGTSIEATGESSAVTLKLDADGQEQWVVRETSSDYSGAGVRGFDVDSAGNVVTVATERFYCMTWKYDANGVRQWTARYRAEESASMYAWDVRFDASGNVLAAANLYGSGINDAVLVKYGLNGEQLWATRIAEPNGVAHVQGMAVDGAGNTYLTMSPVSHMVTVKVGSNGAQLWSITYNDTGFFTDYAQFIQVTAPGDVFVAGRSVYYSESFVSVVKYRQEAVTGVPTALVTPLVQVVDPGTNVLFKAETSGPGPMQLQFLMRPTPRSR